ncbi:universal stress protein [Nordella sp. HKS 07]|uniref:universal stress protein n=1 Tax=Nordella sp. HKS 07 TaxID=2712222 RepID=UPI0013E1BC64|nr:universal stress protein [Nordella sp. HKS 07]QIG48374.1 universal stress protein [Nordella sp. HKS 07]
MTYKTILVSLNDLERNEALLTCAAELARNFDSHLQGLYVIPAVEIYAGTSFGMPVVFEGNRETYQKAEKSVRDLFESLAQVAGISSDFVLVDSITPSITNHVIDYARRSDIAIINQPPEDGGLSVTGRAFVEQILLSTGRPTLVLPRKGGTSAVAELVIIGWSGKRESARAAFDSVPLLTGANEVRVVWVDPEMEYTSPGSLPGVDLATALSRHGVKAVIEPLSTGGREAGEALLTKISDSGAGLLVMGAYGHSRLSELILGGATRFVLSGMNCPVLFSH